jgi:hypothetical protein
MSFTIMADARQQSFSVRDSILSETSTSFYLYSVGQSIYLTSADGVVRVAEVAPDGKNGIPSGQLLRVYKGSSTAYVELSNRSIRNTSSLYNSGQLKPNIPVFRAIGEISQSVLKTFSTDNCIVCGILRLQSDTTWIGNLSDKDNAAIYKCVINEIYNNLNATGAAPLPVKLVALTATSSSTTVSSQTTSTKQGQTSTPQAAASQTVAISSAMQKIFSVRDSILSKITPPLYVYKVGSTAYVTGSGGALRIIEVASNDTNGIPEGQFLRVYISGASGIYVEISTYAIGNTGYGLYKLKTLNDLTNSGDSPIGEIATTVPIKNFSEDVCIACGTSTYQDTGTYVSYLIDRGGANVYQYIVSNVHENLKTAITSTGSNAFSAKLFSLSESTQAATAKTQTTSLSQTTTKPDQGVVPESALTFDMYLNRVSNYNKKNAYQDPSGSLYVLF